MYNIVSGYARVMILHYVAILAHDAVVHESDKTGATHPSSIGCDAYGEDIKEWTIFKL